MKAMVGVDAAGQYRPALEWLTGLGFAGLNVDLVNVVGSVLVDGSFPDISADNALAQLQIEMQRAGQEDLDDAAKMLVSAGVEGRKIQTFGDVTGELLGYADREKIELTAVASHAKDYLGTLFFGSVAKGLVMGATHSILVVKGPVSLANGIHAVFATDHSEYADRCLDWFLAAKPAGIKKVTVVTAFGATRGTAQRFAALMEEVEGANILQSDIEKRTHEVVKKFKSAGYETDFVIESGRPGPVIDHAMNKSNADLLVMGAQGHGFLDRLSLGSVSFHQVVGTSHTVLVVRP